MFGLEARNANCPILVRRVGSAHAFMCNAHTVIDSLENKQKLLVKINNIGNVLYMRYIVDTAARVQTGTRKREHISPTLVSLPD